MPADGREPQVRWLPTKKRDLRNAVGLGNMAVFHHQILTVGLLQRKPKRHVFFAAPFGFKEASIPGRVGYAVGAIWGHVAVLLGDASFGGGVSGRRYRGLSAGDCWPGNTLPETNISPLKIDPWKRRFILETTIFKGLC